MGNATARNNPLAQFGRLDFEDVAADSYVPSPLPRRFGMTADLRDLVDSAEWALGRLSGSCETVGNLGSLLRPSLLAEAVASAKIEGVHIPLGEALIASQKPDQAAHPRADEVLAIDHMMSVGMGIIERRPLDRHVLAELHRTLIINTVGFSDQAGAFRGKTHFVRVPGGGSDSIRAIPAPNNFPALLGDWEDYILNPPSLPVVLRTALIHQRFDTIHPFAEGNDTIGRALVSLHLSREAGLAIPILGISRAISDDLMSYHRSTKAFLDSGDIEPWIAYFARLIYQEATRAQQSIVALHQLLEDMRDQARAEPLAVLALANLLFAHPILDISLVQSTLDITERHAQKVIARAEKIGWIKSLWRPESAGSPYWWAPEIWAHHSPDAPTL
jgi:Fic family protein